MPSRLNVYLVSDSSAETVTYLSRAVTAQFADLEVREHVWPLVKSTAQVEDLAKQLEQEPGIVIYTLVISEVEGALRDRCLDLGIPCVNPMEQLRGEIESYTRMVAIKDSKPGKNHDPNTSSISKFACINYALAHDDGQNIATYGDADIILLGVSRTSKTPTAFYLALRGYKVANLPIIKGIGINMGELKKPLLVGLTINADYLIKVRQNRFMQAQYPRSHDPQRIVEDYLSTSSATEELRYARTIFAKYDAPVLDVTNMAVEEISAWVLDCLFKHRKRMSKS